jgi:plastocyanin
MRRLAGVALVVGAIVVPSLSARADSQQVEIKNASYVPAQRTVNIGDTVTWVNLDNTAHTVTSDDGSFDSSPTCVAGINCMNGGATFAITFIGPGTFLYHCRVHGQAMTGSIIVEDTATTATSTTTTTTTTSTTSVTSTSLPGDQPTITQASLPSPPSTSRAALPKSVIRAKNEDDMRPLVLAAIGIAAATTIAGIVLVRRGRVPLG